MLVATRLGNTYQVHQVKFPGGAGWAESLNGPGLGWKGKQTGKASLAVQSIEVLLDLILAVLIL
jgi:hypothetical protein